MDRIAEAFGIKDPVPSDRGNIARIANKQVTTGDVIGAYVDEVYSGDGSLSQDISADRVRSAEVRGEPITQEQWKAENLHPNVSWYEGVTPQAANVLSEIDAERTERENVISKATGFQKGLGFTSSIGAGIFEPKNFVSGVAATFLTGGVGSAIPTLGRLMSTQTIKGAAIRGGAEGAIGAGLTEIGSQESSRKVQGDYTATDTLMNFGLSMILGAGIGGGVKAYQLRKAKTYIPTDAVQEFDTALLQASQGQPIDVEAVATLSKANKVAEFTTLTKERLESFPDIMQISKGKFEARFNDEQGLLAGARGEGKTPNEAAQDLVMQYYNPYGIKETPQITPDLVEKVLSANNLRAEVKKIESPEYFQAQLKDLPVKEISKIEKQINELESQRITDRKLAKKLAHENAALDAKIVPLKSKLETIKREKVAPQIKAVTQSIREQKQQLRSQIKSLEKDIKTQQLRNAGTSPEVKRFQENLKTPVYDESPQVDVDLEKINMKDEAIDEYEKEQINEMKQQGLLENEDLQVLDNLQEINKNVAVWENIYSNLKNCLVR